jgi:hypothetical protein
MARRWTDYWSAATDAIRERRLAAFTERLKMSEPQILRLYRGEGGSLMRSAEGGGWFTTDRSKAERYSADGGRLMFMDVPYDRKHMVHFAQGAGGKDEYFTSKQDLAILAQKGVAPAEVIPTTKDKLGYREAGLAMSSSQVGFSRQRLDEAAEQQWPWTAEQAAVAATSGRRPDQGKTTLRGLAADRLNEAGALARSGRGGEARLSVQDARAMRTIEQDGFAAMDEKARAAIDRKCAVGANLPGREQTHSHGRRVRIS